MSTFIPKEKEINLLHADSSQMYLRLIESVKAGIYMADADGTLFYVNQAFVNILGYNSKDEVLGLNLAKDLYPNPKDREAFLKAMAGQGGFVKNYVVENKRKDGSIATLEATSSYIRNEKGKIIGVEGVIHDVTEKKRLERELKAEKSKLEQLLYFDERMGAMRNLNKLTDFIMKKTVEILEADRCSLMFLDKKRQELCIRGAIGIDDEIIEKTRVKLGDPIAGVVAQTGVPTLVSNIEYDKRFSRGNRPSYKSRSFMCVPIKHEDNLIGVLNVADKRASHQHQNVFTEIDLKILCAIVREVAVALENVSLYKELKYLTLIDPVTHLCNYRYFVQQLDYEIDRVHRLPAPLSLMMVDIDQFKTYNDTHGHQQGSQLLRKIGELMTNELRTIDKVCRYGGDEFAIIFPGTTMQDAKIVAERIRKSIEKNMKAEHITISGGIAEFTGKLTRFELTRRADSVLYKAKKNGKNKICTFSKDM